MNPARILIVEDDPNIRMGLEELLRGEGHIVASCPRGDEALDAVRRGRPELIVLDVMLPGASGYDICRDLRAAGTRTPVLMLTAKGQEVDKVVGLELGADDYVTKPFGLRELLARVHALLRRARELACPPADRAAPFRIGAAEIDPATFECRRPGAVESLTARELKVLAFFHAHEGEVLSRDRLLNEGWGVSYYGTTRTLDQMIVQLRRKVGDDGSDPKILLTVHGTGYRLVRAAAAARPEKAGGRR